MTLSRPGVPVVPVWKAPPARRSPTRRQPVPEKDIKRPTRPPRKENLEPERNRP